MPHTYAPGVGALRHRMHAGKRRAAPAVRGGQLPGHRTR
jgi:hypothetical protein